MPAERLFTNLAAIWLLPPLDLIVVIAIGLVLAGRRPRLGRAIAATALGVLALLCTEALGDWLLGTLDRDAPPLSATLEARTGGARPEARKDDAALEARKAGAGAIVVLGGGRNLGALEYGGETLSHETLARVRYGARLARDSGLPLLVSGGKPGGGRASEADLMAAALEHEFGATVRWREGESINTIENARYSAKLLRAAGIGRVLLVTDAAHMLRAAERFRVAGIEVVPAPTDYLAKQDHTPFDFLPSARGLAKSNRALREWVGILASRARGV